MSDYDFRLLYPTPGEDPLPVTGLDLSSCDTQSVLCLDASLKELAPFAPWLECEYEGKQAYVTCGYFLRMILLDQTKIFDRAVLQSCWSRTGIDPEVWERMLRVAVSNGLRPAASIGELIRDLGRVFDGLDNAEERIITAEDIIPYEPVSEESELLKDCSWIETQTFVVFHDPDTGSIGPLGMITSSCGDFLDVDIRGADRSLFASVARVWAKAAELDSNLDPGVIACFAAEAVKSSSWPLGFTGPWDTKGNHVMEFDAWVYYVSQQKIGRLRKRFKTFILFEEKRFPQLALLAIKASNNEDFWSAVNILLKSFFTGDPMSIDSWTKLEFKISNPNLLLFTDSPEHKDKELSEWVQYILHQRAESAILVKQHRITGGSESQHVNSGAEYAEFHNTDLFLKFVSHIRSVIESPGATTFTIRCSVLNFGISVLSQWIVGGPVSLTGHDIYKELAPHRLPGGKHLVSDLSEFIGDVVIEFSELQMPLKDVVKYRFPEWAVTAILAGDMFDLNVVFEDFHWQMSKTNFSGRDTAELFQDRERLEQLEKLFTPVFEVFGCGGEEVDLSFASIIQKVRSRLYALKPLASSKDLTIYHSFLDSEPYGVLCWLRGSISLGLQQIGRRFKTRSPHFNEKCFVPLDHTQIRQSFELSEETVKSKLQEFLIIGEFFSC